MTTKFAEVLRRAGHEMMERASAVLDPVHLILNAILYLAGGFVILTLMNSFGPEQARGEFNLSAALSIVLVGLVCDFAVMTPEARKASSKSGRRC